MRMSRISKTFNAIALFIFAAFGINDTESQTIQTLRVVRSAAPPSLGNPLTSAGQPGSGLWSALFDGLTFIGPGGQLLPGLAESWELTNNTRWVFRLRSNVRFHNGTPFDSVAVAAILTFLKSAEGRQFYVSTEVDTIAAIEIIDDLTLAIDTVVPDAILPKRLALIFIPEPGAWKDLGPSRFAQFPVGTGPFMLSDWGHSSGRMEFNAHKHSWRESSQVRRLELWTVSDATARIQALLTGQVDIVEAISFDDVRAIEKAGFRVWTFGGTQVSSIAFRTVGNPTSPLQDVRVRRALNYAVDRAKIAAVLLGGSAKPASQGATTGTFGFDSSLGPIPYDPSRAKALLRDAGHAAGFPLIIEVLAGFNSSDTILYQKVAQDLRAVGLDVTLRSSPFANWLRKYLANDWGNTDAFSLMWDSGPYADAIRPIRNFSCAKAVPFFCDESIMPLIQKTDSIMVPNERERHLKDLMARTRDMAPALLLTAASQRVAATSNIENLILNPPNIAYERIQIRP